MTAALEGGEWSATRPGRTLPPGKTRYPLYRRLDGPQGRSIWDSIPDRPARSQSLYRLSYPAHDGYLTCTNYLSVLLTYYQLFKPYNYIIFIVCYTKKCSKYSFGASKECLSQGTNRTKNFWNVNQPPGSVPHTLKAMCHDVWHP